MRFSLILHKSSICRGLSRFQRYMQAASRLYMGAKWWDAEAWNSYMPGLSRESSQLFCITFESKPSHCTKYKSLPLMYIYISATLLTFYFRLNNILRSREHETSLPILHIVHAFERFVKQALIYYAIYILLRATSSASPSQCLDIATII